MPYVPGTGGISDVYRANNVYANFKLVALWESPGPSALFSSTVPSAPNLSISPQEQEKIDTLVTAEKSKGPDPNIVISDGNPGAGRPANVAAGGSGPSGGTDPDTNQPVVTKVETLPEPPAGGTPYGNLCNLLNRILSESKNGSWKENGKGVPGNPNIIQCYKDNGFNNYTDDHTPWCAGFVGAVLFRSGIPKVRSTLWAYDYAKTGTTPPGRPKLFKGEWGVTYANPKDPSTWRFNDVIVIDRHVAFIRGVDPVKKVVRILGGNQSDNVTECNWGGSYFDKVWSVGRAWTLPPEFDKPITGSVSGQPPLAFVKTL
jgi:uncharacterized protein (TIGR02594 family)